MIAALKSRFHREQFHPTWLGLFINPFYFARKNLHAHVSELAAKLGGKVLDVGCGTKPYLRYTKASEYIGLEIDSLDKRQHSKADFFYDGHDFPFQNTEFDAVITNQVLEHVFHPDYFLAEINRVLKPNSLLLLTVPFMWDEHEQPYDFGRYSSFGLMYLLKTHGFTPIEYRKSPPDFQAVAQLVTAYVYKITPTSSRWADILRTFFLIAPINVFGALFAKILPANQDLFLDNIVLAQKTS